MILQAKYFWGGALIIQAFMSGFIFSQKRQLLVITMWKEQDLCITLTQLLQLAYQMHQIAHKLQNIHLWWGEQNSLMGVEETFDNSVIESYSYKPLL